MSIITQIEDRIKSFGRGSIFTLMIFGFGYIRLNKTVIDEVM